MVAHQNYIFCLNSYFLLHAHMCFGYDMIIDIHSSPFLVPCFFTSGNDVGLKCEWKENFFYQAVIKLNVHGWWKKIGSRCFEWKI